MDQATNFAGKRVRRSMKAKTNGGFPHFPSEKSDAMKKIEELTVEHPDTRWQTPIRTLIEIKPIATRKRDIENREKRELIAFFDNLCLSEFRCNQGNAIT